MFSTFPGGSPGFGLLILRVALGITALFRGAAYLSEADGASFAAWLGGFLIIVVGLFLLAGFLTPPSSALVAAAFLLLVATGRVALVAIEIFAAAQAAALVFLGPGAFSLDARFFGRREIVIAPKKNSLPND